MMRTLIPPTVVLLLLGLAAYFFTAPPLTMHHPIVFASADEIKTLDPGKMSWATDIRAAMGLWEGLASYDPVTLKPIPGVAESWDISADGRTYTFHLRANARWSNGDAVTAQDFLFAWQRVLTPATAAEYVGLFFHIEGAQEYFDGLSGKKAIAFSSVGIGAPDARTLVVHLAHPCTYFLDLVAFPPYYPLHQGSMAGFMVDGKDAFAGYEAGFTRPPHLVTNGPFRLADWRFKIHLLLTPNPYYWDAGAVHAEAIELVTYDDARAALLAYQTHTVDAMSWVPQEFGADLLKMQGEGLRHDVQWRPVFGTYYYLFNCKQKPFDDARVRRALALAVDREPIVKDVLRMGQRPLSVLVPPDSIAGYRSPMGLGVNIPEARRLLAEAGYPEGKGFPTVEMLFNNESIHASTAQALGQMWQQALGVHVSFRGLEKPTFGAERKSHHFALARGGWYGDYTDPTTWLDLARSNNGNNDGQYSNPVFDGLMNRADSEADAGKRFAILQEAEALLVRQDMPFLPLYQYSDGYIFDPGKLAGLELNVRLLTQLKYLHRR